jgi:hypothetical protein
MSLQKNAAASVVPLFGSASSVSSGDGQPDTKGNQNKEDATISAAPSRIDALHLAQAVLQERLQRPVRWELVHESCIFEMCNNYKMAKVMPENLAEQLREEVLAEGPPLWHLDYYKDNWDWKEHK